MNSLFIDQAKSFAEILYAESIFLTFPFHNLSHTIEVVKAAEEVAVKINLDDDDKEILIIAAWLHDIGYVNGAKGHEQCGAVKATEILSDWGLPNGKIQQVSDAILATAIPQSPTCDISKALCDADLFYLSTNQVFVLSDKLREEWAAHSVKFTDKEWLENFLKFMDEHHFHTTYGKAVLEKGKKMNITELQITLKNQFRNMR